MKLMKYFFEKALPVLPPVLSLALLPLPPKEKRRESVRLPPHSLPLTPQLVFSPFQSLTVPSTPLPPLTTNFSSYPLFTPLSHISPFLPFPIFSFYPFHTTTPFLSPSYPLPTPFLPLTSMPLITVPDTKSSRSSTLNTTPPIPITTSPTFTLYNSFLHRH